jgi:NAD(P)-dependent dehydrogenase (short-subunit alcohol dehydrogenase family)
VKRVAIITGAAGGIGRATAHVLSKSGWSTVGVDRVTTTDHAGCHRYIQADISKPHEIENVCHSIRQKEGRLNALVNNAAMQIVKPLIDTLPEEWDQLMAVNVRAPYLFIKHAHPLMKAYGGSIVNVSSVHAMSTSSGMSAYVTSKGALLAMTRSAALELAADQIRVNAILPGAVNTGMLRAGLTRDHVLREDIKQQMDALGKRHALGRIGEPDEIAELIHFLLDGDKSAFITGQSFVIDGGALAQLSTE